MIDESLLDMDQPNQSIIIVNESDQLEKNISLKLNTQSPVKVINVEQNPTTMSQIDTFGNSEMTDEIDEMIENIKQNRKVIKVSTTSRDLKSFAVLNPFLDDCLNLDYQNGESDFKDNSMRDSQFTSSYCIDANNTINNTMNNGLNNSNTPLSNGKGKIVTSYSLKKYPKFNAVFAEKIMQDLCDLGDLLEAERRVLLQPIEILCKADTDGDTPFMMVVAKEIKDGSRFYENVCAMQERLLTLRVCCFGDPLPDFAEACKFCQTQDSKQFHTPLSFKNKVGDSALSCAIKMRHSEVVVNYLLSGLSRNEKDLQKIFSQESLKFFHSQSHWYPALKEFVIAKTEEQLPSLSSFVQL